MASVSEVKKTPDLKLPKTSFAQVVFHNVEETYHVEVDVECTYRINSSLEVSSRDWVGLFKVGWRSSSEYIYYDWSPFPDNYIKGFDVENKVIFPGIVTYYLIYLTIYFQSSMFIETISVKI